jgi:hypothetical protein
MSTPMRRIRSILLRAYRKRPSDRPAANERDELAPFQPIELHPLSPTRSAA